jgi:hypothetical protein
LLTAKDRLDWLEKDQGRALWGVGNVLSLNGAVSIKTHENILKIYALKVLLDYVERLDIDVLKR